MYVITYQGIWIYVDLQISNICHIYYAHVAIYVTYMSKYMSSISKYMIICDQLIFI